MASLDDEILIEPLEENLADDPYGTAVWCIRNILHRAIHVHGGTMNETELLNLADIEELVKRRDNG